MTWRFPPMNPGDLNIDPIEHEFFATETLGGITAALVREAIQNSLDAAAEVILARAIQEGRFDIDSGEDDWGTLWLRFACMELGRPRPPDEPGAEADYWIEEAVNAFCARCQVASHFERMLVAQGD